MTTAFVLRIISVMRPYIGAEIRLVILIAAKPNPIKTSEAPIFIKYKFNVGIITAKNIINEVDLLYQN